MSTTAIFTIDQYEHMIECGAFAGPNAKRIELVRGELRMMSPQGPEHGELVGQLNDWSHAVVDPQLIKVRIQTSVEFPRLNALPEPDIVWAERKSYARRRPEPHEILLLVEVADSSLAYDVGEKCQLYAEAGIRDYWVIDIPNRVVHVHRDPSPRGYQIRRRLSASEQITPLLVDNVALGVARVFACLDEPQSP
jgi:Uma2 family endonuclease